METTSIVPRKAFKSRTGWSFLSSGKIYLRLENITQPNIQHFVILLAFVSDFQSVELRLLAHFSEDPLLLRIFNESEDDIFVQLASIW